MAETFTCPNCGGNLQHDGGDHLTVQCPFCSSTVIVPENMRPRAHRQNFAPLLAQSHNLQQIVAFINENQLEEAADIYRQTYGVSEAQATEAVRRLAAGLSVAGISHGTASTVQVSGPTAVKAGRGLGCFVVAMLLLVGGIVAAALFGGGAALLGIFSAAEVGESAPVNLPLVATVMPFFEEVQETVQETTETAVAPLFAIGERGINPGQFNDARALAIGGDGVIYVADRDSGRLQLFASDGTYQTTWPWDKERYTDDLEIDRSGVLYAQQIGRIFRYDLATGAPLGEVLYTEDIAVSFRKLALTVNGELLAINGVRNTIVRFNAAGQTIQTITLDTVPGAVSIDNVAVDGVGNMYVIGVAEDALGDRQDVIFKFAPDGRYLSQFGSSGNEPGTFMGIVSSIAVDGRGRIYVGDFLGIQVFDNNGRYLDLIELEGVARDLAFNDQGELLAISSQNILYKFDVSQIGN